MIGNSAVAHSIHPKCQGQAASACADGSNTEQRMDQSASGSHRPTILAPAPCPACPTTALTGSGSRVVGAGEHGALPVGCGAGVRRV